MPGACAKSHPPRPSWALGRPVSSASVPGKPSTSPTGLVTLRYQRCFGSFELAGAPQNLSPFFDRMVTSEQQQASMMMMMMMMWHQATQAMWPACLDSGSATPSVDVRRLRNASRNVIGLRWHYYLMRHHNLPVDSSPLLLRFIHRF